MAFFELGRSGQPIISADGKSYAVGEDGYVNVFNSNGTKLTSVALPGARPYGNYELVGLSNDQDKLYLSTWNSFLVDRGAGGVFELNAKNGSTRRIDTDQTGKAFTYQGWSTRNEDIDLSSNQSTMVMALRDTADSVNWGTQEVNIYLKDLASGKITQIDGDVIGGYSARPRANSDASKVLFESTKKLTSDATGNSNIYIWGSGGYQIINKTPGGERIGSNYGWHADLSGDASAVVFQTGEALDPSDTNGISDVYLKDLRKNTITRISENQYGGIYPFISDDGTKIGYQLYNSPPSSTSSLRLYDVNSNKTLELPGVEATNKYTARFQSESVVQIGNSGILTWTWKDYSPTDHDNDADYYFVGLNGLGEIKRVAQSKYSLASGRNGEPVTTLIFEEPGPGDEGQREIWYTRTGNTDKLDEVKIIFQSKTATRGSDFTEYQSFPGYNIANIVPGQTGDGIAFYVKQDNLTEGDEEFIFKIEAKDPADTSIVGFEASIVIADRKYYALSPSATAVKEGESLLTTVSTSNVAAGTKLYYALSGTGISESDFRAGDRLTGFGTINANGTFSFSHTLANDLTTEGTETLDIKLFSDSNRSTQVGSTASVSIRDTSTTPVPTYSLSTSTNALGEGESFSTTVSTTNVAAGTSLFYALSGTGITAADFTAGGLSGSGTVGSDGKFSFSKTLANDLTTEGTETLTVRLYTDNNLSQQVGNAPSITIYDTSTTPQAAININGNNNGIINTGTINNSGTINTGTINTNSGNTTNITNNNIDKSKTITIAPTTINNITNNITNNISVNAVIANTSAPTYNVSNTYAKNLVGDVLTGSAQLNQNSYDAKFYNLGGGRYGVQQKGKSTIDEITGATSLQFQDQAISLASDVAATFNQVKGIDDVSGVVFRLYNAAFARLPDANGLENWINGNKSGGQTYASSALEFAKSQEFKNRYGSNVSDTQYVTTLYNNVLGRDPDAGGLAHYQGLLASGKDRGSLLLDFSESPENRTLFTKVTGLS